MCDCLVDPFAHTIPAAFYRNFNRDLIIEYVPTKLGKTEVERSSLHEDLIGFRCSRGVYTNT